MPSSLVVPSLLLLLCPPTHGSALLLLLLPLLCSEPGHSSRKPSQRGPGARKTSGIPPLGRTRNCKSAAAWTGQTCGWSKKRRRHLTVEGVWSNHEQRGHSHVDDGTKASALSRFTRGSNLLPPPPTSRYLPWHKSPWHNPMSPRLSPSLPQMVGGEATTSCHHICAFFGEFGFTVQFVLAFLSFSALIFKRYQVRNLPPTQAWSLSREVFRRTPCAQRACLLRTVLVIRAGNAEETDRNISARRLEERAGSRPRPFHEHFHR